MPRGCYLSLLPSIYELKHLQIVFARRTFQKESVSIVSQLSRYIVVLAHMLIQAGAWNQNGSYTHPQNWDTDGHTCLTSALCSWR